MISAKIFECSSPHHEASQLTAFSGNRLDRLSENRTEASITEALHHKDATLYAFSGNKIVLKRNQQAVEPCFNLQNIALLKPDLDNAILLGHDRQGRPRLAVSIDIESKSFDEVYELVDARTLYRDLLLKEDVLGEVSQAISLLAWNRDNAYCGKCASKMNLRIGGYKRECSSCGHLIFPRTDPVVIMLNIDIEQDCCLLGRGPHFTPGMYSCLAGFVEPGETLEDAVRRETKEEAGILSGRVKYHASQPWPMPHTIMVGLYAEAKTFDIKRDEQELDDCRWFSREEVSLMMSGNHPNGLTGPNSGAIAHRLMRDWLDWV